MSYAPRLANVVNVLAIRQVKQGTETTRFRIGFTRVNMLALDLIHTQTHTSMLISGLIEWFSSTEVYPGRGRD